MSHESQTVNLTRGGGSVTLTWDVDPFTISEADAAWLLALVRAFRLLKEQTKSKEAEERIIARVFAYRAKIALADGGESNG